MYKAITRNIRVSVTSQFLEKVSRPEINRYFWSYTVFIENSGPLTIQLLSRYWHITNALGVIQEIRGAGVVGEKPTIESGSSYSYSSACPLETPSGIMVGKYKVISNSGELFDVNIPAFSLDSPEGPRTLN
ncbi:MAG: Protein ApaG [Hyphomicrobiaceae bacterium hypho_1]